jgi:hypothetical protein
MIIIINLMSLIVYLIKSTLDLILNSIVKFLKTKLKLNLKILYKITKISHLI